MKNSTATILILVAIGLFYTFTSPQYVAVQSLRAEADEYQKVLDGAAAISATTEEVQSKYTMIPKAEIERLNKVLPDNVDTVRLALDLDGIAAHYGISIRRVQIDKQLEDNAGAIVIGESGSPYEKVSISFSFISNYSNFVKFLADLERGLRITNVKSISFMPSETGLYEHKISVETYWLK